MKKSITILNSLTFEHIESFERLTPNALHKPHSLDTKSNTKDIHDEMGIE
jgi:hypothetical protein